MKTHEKEIIIEKIKTVGKPGLVHYLPHHAMLQNERDKTETRIIFDTSSKRGYNPSLNDCLHASPCLLPLIFDILLRFRNGDVVLIGDIKQAFLNIEIDEGNVCEDFCW